MDKLLRMNDLVRELSISRSTLWRWVAVGKFPRPINVGPHTTAWRESDIQGWIESRALVGDAENGGDG